MPQNEEHFPDILELMRQSASASRVNLPPVGHKARGLWKTLEAFAESNPPAAVQASWQHHAGPEFGTMETFLRPTSRLAQLYPCLSESGCGDPHEAVPLDDGRWLARSAEDMRYCPAIWLTETELAVHELDTERLGSELCRVLDFEPASASGASEAAPKLWPVGTNPATRSPVYLALCPNEGQLMLNMQGLLAICREPFILLAPTARHRSELIGSMLQRERCAFLPLASCLVPDGAGFRSTNLEHPILERFAAGVASPLAIRPMAQNPTVKPKGAARPASGSHGRLRWENDFDDIWVGGVHYDLRSRNTARFCIQFLVERKAFAKSSARHLENEIDPFVRKHAKLPALPASADGNLRIQHYFNDPEKKYNDLRKELVKAAGRNGCFYLQVK